MTCTCINQIQKMYSVGDGTLVECQSCGNTVFVPGAPCPVEDSPPFPVWLVALAVVSFCVGFGSALVLGGIF